MTGLVKSTPDGAVGSAGARWWSLFESVVVNANDVVLVSEAEPIDSASGGPKVVYVNPAFTRMTGYAPEEILGRTPRILQSPKTDRRELDRVRQALARWQPVEVELLNVRKDGTEFWVQLNITPVADVTGWWTHWVAIQRDITARRLRETAVQTMLASTSDLMMMLEDSVVTAASPSAERLLGRTRHSLDGEPWRPLIHQEDADAVDLLLAPLTGAPTGPAGTVQARLRHADGSWRWFELSAAGAGTSSDDGPGAGIVLSCVDITSRKRAEEQLQAVNDRFRSAFDDAPIGMAITEPGGRFVRANTALARLLGLDRNVLQSMSVQDVTHPDDVGAHHRHRQALLAGGQPSSRHETRFLDSRGTVVGVLHSSSIVPGPDGRPQHLVDHVEDITDRQHLERSLRHQALHDPLTGLPNRTLLLDRLQHALHAAGRSRQTLAVIFLDLDRFKHVNDTHGHHIGDLVLVTVARRLQAALRPADTAARLSGDEFVVLCQDATPADADHTAARLAEVLTAPVPTDTGPLGITASIGVTLSTAGSTPDSLLRAADTAMYTAKTHRTRNT